LLAEVPEWTPLDARLDAREDGIRQMSTGTTINPRSTRGTTTAAMTIAASVSIIPSQLSFTADLVRRRHVVM
jgi:hypothetical protein